MLAILLTCFFIDSSLSKYTPRSRLWGCFRLHNDSTVSNYCLLVNSVILYDAVALNWTISINLNLICQLPLTFDSNKTHWTHIKPSHNIIICAVMKMFIDLWIRKSRWVMKMLVAIQCDTWWDGDWQQGDGRRTDGRHVVRVPCSSCQRSRCRRVRPDQGTLCISKFVTYLPLCIWCFRRLIVIAGLTNTFVGISL